MSSPSLCLMDALGHFCLLCNFANHQSSIKVMGGNKELVLLYRVLDWNLDIFTLFTLLPDSPASLKNKKLGCLKDGFLENQVDDSNIFKRFQVL